MSVRLAIKVVPGASRSAIAGWLGDELKIRVAAPPEKGRANREVIKILATALKLPATHLNIVSGLSSPRKTIEVAGIEQAAIVRLIGCPPGSQST